MILDQSMNDISELIAVKRDLDQHIKLKKADQE
jgi:hypothetical protein